MIRVLIVDDQALVRGGFRAILSAIDDIDVVGEAADGREAVQSVAALSPDVVLMDIRMPLVDGIEATRSIMAGPEPRPRIVVLTTFDADRYVYDALAAGAAGFLLKDLPPADLAEAVRTAANGGALLAPEVTRRLIEAYVQRPRVVPGERDPFEALTSREREVLVEVARGLSNAEIGGRLFLSEATVKTHLTRILAKLGLRDRVQAVVLAYETGLVEPGR